MDGPNPREPRGLTFGTPLRKAKFAARYDAIIIGSGIGGLTVAAFLAEAGQRVLVLEKHYTAGGLTHTFRRRGFEWNTGLHYIGRVHRRDEPLRQCFDHLSRGRLKWERLPETVDRLVFPGFEFDIPRGQAHYTDALLEIFPQERVGIDAYMALLGSFRDGIKRYAAMRVVPNPVAKLLEPLVARGFHWMASRTTAEVLGELTSNPKLVAVLAGRYMNYGLPPSLSSFAAHAGVESHYLEGANFPVGGSRAIAKEVCRTIEEAGGEIVVQAGVSQILVEGNRAVGVQLEDGRTLTADRVISGVGARATYNRLLGHLPRFDDARTRVSELEPSMAHVCLYLGLRGSREELGLPATNQWVHSSLDYESSFRAWRSDPDGVPPVVYIAAAKKQDPSPQGGTRTAVEVIAPFDFRHVTAWRDTAWKKRGADYEGLKAELSERLMGALERRSPGIREHVEVQELSTPLSTVKFSGHAAGEMYGVAGVPARYSEPALRVRTGIRNFFLTGQDSLFPGVGGAMMAGLVASAAILRKNLMGTISNPPPVVAPPVGADS